MNLSRSRVAPFALCVGILGGITVSSGVLAAEGWDIGFQPHIEVGVADYKLDFSATSQYGNGGTISTGQLSFQETMPTISAGLTMFANRFFLDLAVQRMQNHNQNLSDSHTIFASNSQFRQTVQESYVSDDFTRDEYTLSVGYGVTDSFSVYAGYKKQFTDMDDLIGTGPISQQNTSDPTAPPLQGTFDTSADIKFDYDGPFAGATTGWQLDYGDFKGRLNVSAAIAFMDGTLKAESSSAFVTFPPLPAIRLPVTLADILNTEGDAVGITLGATWVGQTSVEDLSYSVGINGYQYDFSADVDGRPEVNETVLQLKLGLAYAF